MAEERFTGVVQWFNNGKGFGFIKPDDGGEDLFVHQSSIRSDGFRTLVEGDLVEFTIETGDNEKTKAVDVTGLNGAPLQSRQDSYGGGGGGRGFGGGFRGSDRRNGGGAGGAGCYNCGDTGHIARECNRNNNGGGGGGGGACYTCGSFGHIARDCMGGGGNGRAGIDRGSGGGGVSCYRCSGFGHIARDCATGRTGGGGGGGCYKCGEVGHIARDCSIESGGGRFDGGGGRFDGGNGRFGDRNGGGGKNTCFTNTPHFISYHLSTTTQQQLHTLINFRSTPPTTTTMADIVKQLLAKPIQLADQVSKSAEEGSSSFKQECLELKSKTEKLAALLRQAARASSDLNERPTRRIIGDTEQVLEKALTLVLKCKVNGLMKRVFSIVPSAAFRKMSFHLENSIGDVSWLLRVSAPAEERGFEYLGLPPIAANEPILGLIWEQIAILHTGSFDDRSDAAASLVSLVRDNDRNGKLIIEEGGVGPLLKLLKEGKKEGQENAARAIGLLGRDSESVEIMIHAGVCSVFAKILKEGPMKVQGVVAWCVSELVSKYPKCQDLFAQHNIVRLLVSHIAFETVQEHSKYAIVSNKPISIHAVVLASSNNSNDSSSNDVKKENDDEVKIRMQHPLGDRSTHQMHKVVASTMALHAANNNNNNNNKQQVNEGNEVSQNSQVQVASNTNANGNGKQGYAYSGINVKGRELENSEDKANMKAMAAKALRYLAKDNSAICRSITESRALLCFAILLEKGPEEVKYHSALALKEITAVAEKDPELRRSAFKPNSPACKAVVDQVIDIIDKEDKRLLIPCIKTIGSLARTFRATETRIIGPLVRLLDERDSEVMREAADSLTKFACNDNYLHLDHSKAIISSGGAKHLVQLVYIEQTVRYSALTLLAYIALHVPDSEELARAEVLAVLEWASKQPNMIHDEKLEALLQESKSRLELYQSRGSRGFQKLHQ